MDSGFYAAIAAIIAPVLTALINNRHHYRMRKIELVQAEKIKAIQEYAESCSNCIDRPKSHEKTEYSRSYGKIFLYADKRHWKDIKAIDQAIQDENYQLASEKLASVCQALSKDMKV